MGHLLCRGLSQCPFFVFPTRWLWWGLNPRPSDYQADVLPPDHPAVLCHPCHTYTQNLASTLKICHLSSFQCAGNHEFDYGQQAFMAFANSLSFPLLSANLDTTGVPGASVPRSTVVRVGAERIGVVGYTTTDTTFISFPGRWELGQSKEGVLLRNVSAAPICDHFAVVPSSSRIREPVPFLV